MSLHGCPRCLLRCVAIPRCGKHAFQPLSPVGSGALKMMRHAVDLDKDLIKVPAPGIATAHSIHLLAPKFRRETWAKPVPTGAYGFMADKEND